MTVNPPLLAGGVKETVAVVSPAVAETLVGGSGRVAGVAFAVVADPVPKSVIAMTLVLYNVPLVSDEIIAPGSAEMPSLSSVQSESTLRLYSMR